MGGGGMRVFLVFLVSDYRFLVIFVSLLLKELVNIILLD